MEDKKKIEKNEKPKSRFKSGSIHERWADDEDEFINCFISNDKENPNNK